jgi:YjbE family integral membrane protein
VGLNAVNHDASVWTQFLQAESDNLRHPTFWMAAARIVFVNTLLSGDNAIVIALACRSLPRRQRILGVAIGAGVAVFLLVALTAIAVQLIALPYLKIAGGLALLYIAARLLLPEQQPDEKAVAAATHLWRAVRIVVVADLVMSFDNVIAVATAARGDLALLAVGLIVSIPIIMVGAAVIMALLDRLPFLIWIGAAFLGSIGGEAIATDPTLFGYLGSREAVWAASAAGAVLVIVAGGFWRSRFLKAHAAAPRS